MSLLVFNSAYVILTNKGQSFQNFFRLSPGFCFADGLASLALLRQGMKNGSRDNVLDWNVTGASISYLAAEVAIWSADSK